MSVFNLKSKSHLSQFHLYVFASLFFLNGCGGGGGTATPTDKPVITNTVTGAGVKGPMANAKVTAYEIDSTKVDLKGIVAGTGTTDAAAQITGLTIPAAKTPPFILEFTSVANTTDITTGKTPVITKLRTVLTQQLIATGNVYASLQTTMATDIAIANADSNVAPYTGDNNGTVTSQELLTALPIAASQVMSTFGFGATSSVDIFTVAPLITATTITDADQKLVAEYRTAIEAMTALVFELGKNVAVPVQTAEAMFIEIIADLSDGLVDGLVNGAASAIIDSKVLTGIVTLDPAILPIPNSDDGTGAPYTVGEVEVILVAEKAITGATTVTTNLGNGTIVVTPVPAVTDPDTDKDTIADFVDNCPLNVNTDQSDTNNNGVGDVCDKAPVAVNDSVTVDEGATVTVLDSAKTSVLSNDTDVEGDTLTASLITGPTNAIAFALNADGTFSYQHNSSETINDSFTYRVNDGSSDSVPDAIVNITINPINDLPVAVNDSINVLEGGTVTVLTDAAVTPTPTSVLYNDTDAENDSLTVTLVNAPVNVAVFVLNADGTFNYQHNATQTTTDSFTYSISDGTGNSLVDGTVNIVIAAVNNLPIAKNDSITVDEGATVTVLTGGIETSVLSNDTDADLNTLSAKLVSVPTNASNFVLNTDGTFSYTHNGTETITDSFTYLVSDGFGDSVSAATVSITINPVNDNPIPVADTDSIKENASIPNTIMGNVLANDKDPDNLQSALKIMNPIVAAKNAAYGMYTLLANGDYSYTLDEANPTVNALATGESLIETINFTVIDGVGGSAGSSLVITINGTTDVAGVDMSGVWQITSTVQSITPGSAAGCEILNDVSISYATIKQTGAALDIKTHLGANFTGIIDTATGVFSIPSQTTVRQIADLSKPANDKAPLVNFTETVIASGTTISQTSISNGQITTSRSVGGIPGESCDYTESFTASFLYKHTGTEQYNGIYGDEGFNEAYYSSVVDGIYADDHRTNMTLEYEIIGTILNVYLPGFNGLLPSSTTAFSNLSYDPINGYFTGTLNLDLKVDTTGDGMLNLSYVSVKTLTGIFIRPPTKNIDGTQISGGSEGANAAPIVAASLFGYNRLYLGDKTVVAQEEVSIEAEDSYQKRLTTTGLTRTAIVEKGDLTLENHIKIGLVNPPLKKFFATSKLYLEVLDAAQNQLCSVPYQNETGLVNHRYFRNVNMPDPSFNGQLFRSSVYAAINCKLLPPASNASSVIIQLRDTGADGIKGGVAGTLNEDTVTVISQNYIPEPFTPAFTKVIPTSSISVNGATASSAAVGSSIPILGYFDFTEPTQVLWPKHPETAVSYQLRHEKVEDPEAIKYRYRTKPVAGSNTLNATIQAFKLDQGTTLRVVAFNNSGVPGSGAVAQSFTRRLIMNEGVNGLFDVDLGIGIIDQAYRTLQLSLKTVIGGAISCTVMGNANMSCGTVATNVFDPTLDTIDLTMTDITGSLSGAGTTFTLTLHFKTTGVVTSNSAVVTSPNASLGIPTIVTGATTSAILNNP